MKAHKKGEAENLAFWKRNKGSLSVVLQLQNGCRTWKTYEEEHVPSETGEAQPRVCVKEQEGDDYQKPSPVEDGDTHLPT